MEIKRITMFLMTLFLCFSFNVIDASEKKSNSTSQNNKKEDYIILFKNKTKIMTRKKIIENKKGILGYQFKKFPISEAKLTSEQVKELSKNPEIITIEKNQTAHLSDVSPPPISEQDYNKTWDLDKTNIQAARNDNLTGKNVNVAVIDTGIGTKHPYLNVAENWDCVSDNQACITKTYEPRLAVQNDEGFHGTHVAGIIGMKNNNGVEGIAPDVNLVDLTVFDSSVPDPSTDLLSVLKALEWITLRNTDRNKDDHIDIANMSLSFLGDSDSLHTAIQDAYQSGCLIIVSMGNNATDVPQYPAAYPEVVSVGATTQNNTLANFSNYGQNTSLVAPGYYIYSTIPYDIWNNLEEYGTLELASYDPNTHDAGVQLTNELGSEEGYLYLCGTSMSSPVVAGVAALLKQEFPDYNNYQIKRLLLENAQHLGNPGKDNQFGYGLAQATPITIDNPYFNMWMKEKDKKPSYSYNDSLSQDFRTLDSTGYLNPYQQYFMNIPSYWFIDHSQPDKYVRFFFHDFKVDLTFKPETDADKRTNIINQSINNLNLTNLTPKTYTSGQNSDLQVTEYQTSLPSSNTMNQQFYYFVNAPNGVYTFSVLTNNTNLSSPNGLPTIHDEMQNVLDSFMIDTSVAPNEITNDQLNTLAQTRVDGNIVPSNQYVFGADLGMTNGNDPTVLLSRLESKVNTHFGSMTYDVQLDPYSIGVADNDKIVEKIVQAGKMPVINMEMGNWGQTFRLQKILGDSTVNYDNLLIAWADYLKQTNTTVLLNLGSGFNGSYSSANASMIDGPEPDIYKLAYRHVVDIFRQEGATNVKFIWTPNYVSQPDDFWNKMEKYYPGDDYVDWIGMMGEYFPGSGNFSLDVSNTSVNMQRKTQSFDDMFQSFYQNLRYMYPDKPMMMELKSTVSPDDPNEKANFVQQMFNNIPSEYKNIQLVTWDENPDNIYNGNESQSEMEDDSSLNAFTNNLNGSSIEQYPSIPTTP